MDVGVVELTRPIDGKRVQSQYEIDFVVNIGNLSIINFDISGILSIFVNNLK